MRAGGFGFNEQFGFGLQGEGGTLAFPYSALLATDGAVYQPSDLTSLFSDTAGTTAAVVDGPVGKMLDKSGHGHHCTASSDAARPTLRLAGGLYYLEFDGTDDRMAIAGSLDGTASAIGMAAKLRSAPALVYLTGLKIDKQALVLSLGSSLGFWGSYAGGDLSSGAWVAATSALIVNSRAANDVDLYTNADPVVNVTSGTAYDTYAPGLGGNPDGTQCSAMDFYGGAVFMTALDAARIVSLKAWLDQLAGL